MDRERSETFYECIKFDELVKSPGTALRGV